MCSNPVALLMTMQDVVHSLGDLIGWEKGIAIVAAMLWLVFRGLAFAHTD